MGKLGQLRLSINDVAFSEDDQRVVGASTGTEAVRVWDRTTQHDLLTLPTDVLMSKVAFSPCEQYLGALDDLRRVHIWRAPSWEEIAAVEAKDPPAPGYGGQGKAEGKQP